MNLELVPTTDLLEELAHRFDHLVFAGIKHHTMALPPSDENPEGQTPDMIRSWRYKGTPEMCQGLAFGLQANIQQQIFVTEEPIGPEDV